MTDIPLFPLNTVLFPGMPLSLHIFEERYKQMINTCISEKIPFGVVLIEEGQEALGPVAKPYTTGCSARITQVQPLIQGRMNLVAVGEERFRVLELDRESQPYLVGRVENDPMPVGSVEELESQIGKLRPYVIRYLEIRAQAGDVQLDPDQLPTESMALAYLSAFILSIESSKKQVLLEAEDAPAFVAGVRALYSTENALLETMLKYSELDDAPGNFSLN
jgi:uncharacterized protein